MLIGTETKKNKDGSLVSRRFGIYQLFWNVGSLAGHLCFFLFSFSLTSKVICYVLLETKNLGWKMMNFVEGFDSWERLFKIVVEELSSTLKPKTLSKKHLPHELSWNCLAQERKIFLPNKSDEWLLLIEISDSGCIFCHRNFAITFYCLVGRDCIASEWYLLKTDQIKTLLSVLITFSKSRAFK